MNTSEKEFIEAKISEQLANFRKNHNVLLLSKKKHLLNLIEKHKIPPGVTTLDNYYN